MISGKIEYVISELKRKGRMRFLDGVTEAQILEFEKERKIKIPEQYRTWLTFTDGGEVYLPAGIQFFGIAHKPCMVKSKDKDPEKMYLIIGTLPNGDPIFLKINNGRVAIYNAEAGRIEKDEIYKDFLSFIDDLEGILGIGE